MTRLAALLLGVGLLSGCVTVLKVRSGNPIEAESVAAIQSGTRLPQVLARLGAPLEVHRHAEGKLLVYRVTGRNTFRLGIDASQPLRFVDTTQLLSEAAGNLSLTIDRVHADEDRVVILFGPGDRVRAVGYRKSLHELPVF